MNARQRAPETRLKPEERIRIKRNVSVLLLESRPLAMGRQIAILVNFIHLIYICLFGIFLLWFIIATQGYIMNLLGMAKLFVSLLYTNFSTATHLV